MPVGFLPVALPNQNGRRPLGLSLQHGRQTCRRRAFGLVQTVQSLFKMTHLLPEGGEQPNDVVKDTLFAQDFVDRQTPFTLNQPRLGLLKPLSSNSTSDRSFGDDGYFTGWLAPHPMANNDACGHVTMPHRRMGPLFLVEPWY